MNAVSTISGIEMPSTPSVYQALKAPIHGFVLDELHRPGSRRIEVTPQKHTDSRQT
jgi:hypothetical protein